MLADAPLTTILPVLDLARARTFYEQKLGLPGLKTVDHVCVLGSEKVAWFSDPEGNILCLHEDVT
jgi:predicted enzyme related to lactoylglutathione lyase